MTAELALLRPANHAEAALMTSRSPTEMHVTTIFHRLMQGNTCKHLMQLTVVVILYV